MHPVTGRRRKAADSLKRFVFALAMSALGVAPASAQAPPGAWVQLRTADFTVFYAEGYSQDSEQARQSLDSAATLMREQYRLDRLKFPLRVYLFPQSATAFGSRVTKGASFFTSFDEGGQKVTAIAHLTASSSEFRDGSNTTTGNGMPFDAHYHRKVLVHEFVHAIQYSLNQDGAPAWPTFAFEGEAEAVGVSLAERDRGLLEHELFLRAIEATPQAMVCCSRVISGSEAIAQSGDRYVLGYAFNSYLIRRWGFDLLRRLHASRSEYMEGLRRETGMPLAELFTGYQVWLRDELAALPAVPPFRVNTPLALDVAAETGSDRVLIVTPTILVGATSSAPWLTLESVAGRSGSFYRTLSWTANASSQPRTASINLRHSSGYSITVTVTQKGQ